MPSSVPRERDVVHAIRQAVGAVCWLHVNAVGVTRTAPVIRYGLGTGSADLIGCLDGRFFALEVKRPGQHSRPEQVQWAEMIRRNGGFVAEVHSAEEAMQAVDRCRQGKNQ
jgi:hypothetical protein